jgi:hypothetical protein
MLRVSNADFVHVDNYSDLQSLQKVDLNMFTYRKIHKKGKTSKNFYVG